MKSIRGRELELSGSSQSCCEGLLILRAVSRTTFFFEIGNLSALPGARQDLPAECSLDVISRSQLTSQTLKYLFLDSNAGKQWNPEGRLVWIIQSLNL